MGLMDLLMMPGMDSSKRLRELRIESQNRMMRAYQNQRRAQALQNLAHMKENEDKDVVHY